VNLLFAVSWAGVVGLGFSGGFILFLLLIGGSFVSSALEVKNSSNWLGSRASKMFDIRSGRDRRRVMRYVPSALMVVKG